MAVPSVAPLASSTRTVAPTSPVPMTSEPVGSIMAVGASGAVRSGAMTVAGDETSPSASVWVTRTVSPLRCGVVSVAV